MRFSNKDVTDELGRVLGCEFAFLCQFREFVHARRVLGDQTVLFLSRIDNARRHLVGFMVPPVQPISFRSVREEFQPTLSLALPLVLAEIGWMSMGVVDTIMVGRLPNSAVAIGATGLGQSLYHSVAIFGAGLLLGMDTFVAQAHGREDICDARHSLVNGVFLALVLTPVLMVLVGFWPMLMQRLGVSQLLVGPMRPFLSALNWGTLPLLSYFALRRYLQAVHVVRPIMFALFPKENALRSDEDRFHGMLAQQTQLELTHCSLEAKQ